MNREELRRYIMEEYHAENDFPWLRYPENEVFRHPANRKWFALIMEVTGDRLGLPDQEKHAVVNLKCDPLLIGSLRAEPGFFPCVSYEQGKLDYRRSRRQYTRRQIKNAAGAELRGDRARTARQKGRQGTGKVRDYE